MDFSDTMDKPSPQKIVSSWERSWKGFHVSQDCNFNFYTCSSK